MRKKLVVVITIPNRTIVVVKTARIELKMLTTLNGKSANIWASRNNTK